MIGPGSLGAINLAGSVAGSQRNAADADRVKERSAERNVQSDLKALAAKSLDDVGQADESHDRDADGRTPFGGNESPPTDVDESGRPSNHHRAGDPDGVCGRLLDLEG